MCVGQEEPKEEKICGSRHRGFPNDMVASTGPDSKATEVCSNLRCGVEGVWAVSGWSLGGLWEWGHQVCRRRSVMRQPKIPRRPFHTAANAALLGESGSRGGHLARSMPATLDRGPVKCPALPHYGT